MTINVKFRGIPIVVEYTYTEADFSDRDEPPVYESVTIESVHTAHGDDVTEWFADEWCGPLEEATLKAHKDEYRAAEIETDVIVSGELIERANRRWAG